MFAKKRKKKRKKEKRKKKKRKRKRKKEKEKEKNYISETPTRGCIKLWFVNLVEPCGTITQ